MGKHREGRQQISKVAVTYLDGSTRTFEGKGSVLVTRTPADRGAPTLKDTDLWSASATVVFGTGDLDG